MSRLIWSPAAADLMPRGFNAIRPTLTPRDAATLLAVAIVYIAAGRLGLSLAFEHPSASPVWPPTGIAIAAVLILGHWIWPAVAIGAFLVNFGVAGAVLSSLAIAAGNTAEALLAGWLVTRFAKGRCAFDSVRGSLQFVICAGILATLVSATTGTVSIALGGLATVSRLPAIGLTWWLGDMAGALVVAPLILLWHSNPTIGWTRRQAFEAMLWLVLLSLLCVSFFTGLTAPQYRPYIRPFPLIPLLICISIRFGMREAATGLLLVASVAIRGTLLGFGPFVLSTPNESLLLLQGFLAVGAVLTLVPAAMASERRHAEARQQAFFDQAVVGIADCDFEGRFLRVNQRFCDMLGYRRDELLSRSVIDITHPEDRSATRARFERLKTEGVPSSADKRYVRRDGTTFWVRAVGSRVLPGPGQDAYVSTVVEDITSRKQVEGAIKKAAIHEERSRLAGEIHDHLSQSFVGIILHLENAAEILPRENHSVRQLMDRAAQLARTALDHARRSGLDLGPSALESSELPVVLRAAASALLAGTGVGLEFQCAGNVRRLALEIEEQLFYIGQEAIANAWRHGVPSKLSCRLQYDASELHMEVTDDGRAAASEEDDFYGLITMQERARRIGAQLTLHND